MQFQAVYEEKKMSAAEMAARIPDASHIFSDIFLAQPKTLYEAINNRCLADSMRSCTITTYLDLYPLVCYTEPIRFAKNLQGTSVFCSALTRKAVGQGLVYFVDLIPLMHQFLHIRRLNVMDQHVPGPAQRAHFVGKILVKHVHPPQRIDVKGAV